MLTLRGSVAEGSIVWFFSRRKDVAVQSFILKLVNSHCAEVDSLNEGPRVEGRVNLTVVVLVVPLEKGVIRADHSFSALSKEFATGGMSLVLNQPRAVDEVLIGFWCEGQMKYLRGKAKHLSPIGGGFYQLGVELMQMVHASDHPGLEKLTL